MSFGLGGRVKGALLASSWLLPLGVVACSWGGLSGSGAPEPVVIWYESYDAVFQGSAVSYGGFRGGSVDVERLDGSVRCVGPSDYRVVPPGANPIDRCEGITGSARLSCSDGRRLTVDWWFDESCQHGYGAGTDSDERAFHLAFGGSHARADAMVREASPAQRSKPPLPAPGTAKGSASQSMFSTGTAFFVTWDGHLLTNHHVVRDAERIQVRLDEGEFVEARLVRADEANDLAVLHVEAIRTPLAVRKEHRLVRGQEVFTLGYPLIKLQGSEQKATFGRINALSGLQGDDRFTQIDVPIQPGNSGGPLIDTEGDVVGIVTSMLHPRLTLETVGVVPQNVNYAIKSDLAYVLLSDSTDLGEPPARLPRLEQSYSQLVAEAEDSVVLVLAW